MTDFTGTSPGQAEMAKLQAAGFTDEEIGNWQAQTRQNLSAAGFNDVEADQYFGRQPLDEAGVKEMVQTNLQNAKPPAPAEGAAKAPDWQAAPRTAEGFADNFVTGLQLSSGGLMARGGLPNKVLPENPTTTEGAGAALGGAIGDLPAGLAGFILGGGQITGAGGAFALPAGLRATLYDGYTKGQFLDFKDFWHRASSIMAQTVKAEALGMATAGAGKVAGAFKTPYPVLDATLPTAAELATLTTVGAALEGRVPKYQDFVNAAFVLFGFKAAKKGADMIAQVWARTGMSPDEIVQSAQQNPAMLEDMILGNFPESLKNIDMKDVKDPNAYIDRMFGTGKYVPEKRDIKVAQNEPAAGVKAAPVPQAVKPATQPAKQVAAGGTPPPNKPPTPPVGGGAGGQTPQDIVASRIVPGEQVTGKTWADRYRQYVDQFADIEQFTKAMGGAANASVDPIKLIRLTAGSSGKAEHFINFGTLDGETLAKNGESLKSALKPVGKNTKDFETYAVASRAVELDARGINTGVDIAASKQVIRQGRQQFEAPFRGLVDYQNRLTEYLKSSGILDEETYQKMLEANRNYVPFYRFFGDEFGGPGAAGRGFSTRNPVKAIKGAEEQIVSPIESIVKNTHLYITLAERNRAGRALWDMVKADPGLAESLGVKVVPTPIRPIEVQEPEVAKFLNDHGLDPRVAEPFTIFRAKKNPVDANQIRFFVDGKAATLEVPPGIAEGFKGMDASQLSTAVKWFSYPAAALRAGTTLSPDFFFRNLSRDQFTKFVQAKGYGIPIVETLRGMGHVIGKSDTFQKWLAGGGANSAWVSIDRDYISKNIVDLNLETGLMDKTWNVAKTPFQLLQVTSELFENATRVGEFERVLGGAADAASVREAALQSREATLDFARSGSAPAIKAMAAITPFWRPTITGLDTLARAFKDRPNETLFKAISAITIPSLILWSVNHLDPRWKDIPRWQKDLFWIFFTDKWEQPTSPGQLAAMQAAGLARQAQDGSWRVNNGHAWRVPKPPVIGQIFGSFFERVAEKFVADNPDGLKDFTDTMVQQLSPAAIPAALSPVAEQFANRSLFTNNPLIPANVEGWLPEYQYTPYTSETAKLIGGVIGHVPGVERLAISPDTGVLEFGARAVTTPALIDNYVQGWTGGLGKYVVQIADAGLRAAGVVPDPVKPAKTLADLPVVKAFVVRYPAATAQSIQDFYDRYYQSKRAYDTIIGLAKQGDAKAAQKELDRHAADMAQVTDMREALTNMSRAVQLVNKNPEMAPDEKRQIIDTIYYQMTVLAQAGNHTLDAIDKLTDNRAHP